MDNNDVIIEVRDVEFGFLIQSSGINSLKQFLFTFGTKKLFEKKQVLKGMSFDVHRGECFGLVGLNGAGKSTLLRVIAGIISPQKGYVKTYGKISPVLAIGVGLEFELTGIENIRVLCALLGMSKKETGKTLDYIIDFSELSQDDIKMQVKRYSTGMLARLAFSIAVANIPDILMIDEVLAVGDAGFQQKCIKRIMEIRDAGATVLFVSHDYKSVAALCSRVAYLKNGVIEKIGTVDEIGKIYYSQFN